MFLSKSTLYCTLVKILVFILSFLITGVTIAEILKLPLKSAPIKPYSVKDLSYTADYSTEDTQYATVVRSRTKAYFNIVIKKQVTVNLLANLQCKSLCHSRYYLLKFYHKAEIILKSSEEDQ